jgi:hypothetical protein
MKRVSGTSSPAAVSRRTGTAGAGKLKNRENSRVGRSLLNPPKLFVLFELKVPSDDSSRNRRSDWADVTAVQAKDVVVLLPEGPFLCTFWTAPERLRVAPALNAPRDESDKWFVHKKNSRQERVSVAARMIALTGGGALPTKPPFLVIFWAGGDSAHKLMSVQSLPNSLW